LILTCENCLRRYSIADDMLRGKAIRLRCKGCQHIMVVPAAAATPRQSGARGGTEPRNGAPWHGLSAVASPVETSLRWFAIIMGRQSGPFGLKELEKRQESGEIGGRTYVWRPGMTDWRRVEELSELSSLFNRRDKTGDGEAQAHHLRESFEQVPSAGPITASRLAGLKLSPNLVAAAPQAAREAEKEEVPNPAPDGAELTATPGDETRFFIAQAGMHKRNPPWKIAAFVGSLIALPAAVLYLLAAFKIGPLVVTRIDASGNEIRESVFAEDGVSGLRDLLSGRQRRAKAPHDSHAARPAAKPLPAPAKASEAPGPATQRPNGPADLRAFYADGTKADVGPTVRSQRKPEEGGAGLAPAEIAKVVGQTQPAFQFCIEQEMKKNPSFKGGKIFINAVIGGSGTVKQVAISRPDIDGSSLGECLKGKARRMIFAAYSGDDTVVQIPLILTTSL
jgi:predicted Zn finger-like uncharacterized protein